MCIRDEHNEGISELTPQLFLADTDLLPVLIAFASEEVPDTTSLDRLLLIRSIAKARARKAPPLRLPTSARGGQHAT